MILSWSYSPIQIILVSSSLTHIPRPKGQSEATPEDVKWLSVVMSLNRKCFYLSLSASPFEIKLACPGVKLWYFPESPNFWKISTIVFSNFSLSSLFILGGKFQPATFLATLALMETSVSLGSILVKRYCPTGMLQSCSCLVFPSIL